MFGHWPGLFKLTCEEFIFKINDLINNFIKIRLFFLEINIIFLKAFGEGKINGIQGWY